MDLALQERLHLALSAQRRAFEAERMPSDAVRRDRLQRLLAMTREHGEVIATAIAQDFGHRARPESQLADLFTVEAGHEPERAVGGGVLGTHVDEHGLRPEFGLGSVEGLGGAGDRSPPRSHLGVAADGVFGRARGHQPAPSPSPAAAPASSTTCGTRSAISPGT